MHVYMHGITMNGGKSIKLKEILEEYMGRFRGKKEKREMSLFYYLKSKFTNIVD